MAGQMLGSVCPGQSKCPGHVPEVAGACAKIRAHLPRDPRREVGGLPSY